MGSLLAGLFLLLGLLPSPPIPGDELEEALARFREAGASGEEAERAEALAVLTALEELEVSDALVEELSRSRMRLREAQLEGDELAARLAQADRTLGILELRAERDPDMREVIVGRRSARELAAEKLESVEEEVAGLEPWCDSLSAGYVAWLEAVHPSVKKKAVRSLSKSLDEEELWVRLAAVELLGEVGAAGTALDLQGTLEELCSERASIERKLPKMEAELKKIAARMQKEAVQTGGRIGSLPQYRAASRETAALRRQLTILSLLCDGTVDAAATALSRETEGELLKTLPRLVRAFDGAKSGARLRSVAIFVRSRVPAALEALRVHLEDEKDPATIAIAIDEWGRAGLTAQVPEILGDWLDHESPHVRSAAIRSLALLRDSSAIPALISRLEAFSGRQRSDVRAALVALTGQNFHGSQELWDRWWSEAGTGFQVPPLAEVEASLEEAQGEVGVTFFGITTESQRVLFVLDLSGSMNFSMTPRYNPNDDPGRPPDLPRGTEPSRLDEAKRALRRSIGGLRKGATFNLVLYASDSWQWKSGLVEMDGDVRLEVLEHVDGLEAVGGTNLFGALRTALEVAGADGGDEFADPPIDTIFLLTDGRPSIGVTTDADAILEFVDDRNRSAGIVIHTIGLSGAQDAYLLGELARRSGGTYVAR